MAAETEWLLFIDESGNFDVRAERVCIGGFMLQEADKELSASALRRLLDEALPHVPYPPHASWMRREAFHLATWMLQGRQQRKLISQGALAALADAVANANDSSSRRFVQAVKAGEVPDYRDLSGVAPALAHHRPAEFQALRALVERSRDGMVAALQRLGAAYPGGAAFVVAAAETTIPQDGGPGPRDRYLALLQVLLERVFAVLRAEPAARHKVWVRAAERRVRVPEGLSLHLRAADVAGCIRAAELEPPLEPATSPDPHVRLVPAQPPRFDAGVHPGVVLADFVSNMLRVPLSGAASLERLDQAVRFRAQLPLSVAPRLAPDARASTAAADGLPRRAIAEAFRLRPAPELGGVRPGWAREQAERWIELARGGAR